MKTYTKNYIGKGKQVNGLDVVRMTLKVDDLIQHKYEKEGIEYITFEIAKLKESDKFGRTHTAYVSKVEEPAPKAKKSRKRA